MNDSTERRLDQQADDSPLLHEFKNHLAVIIGFCDLLLRELPDGDSRRADVQEIRKASTAAIALLPELSARMR